MVGIEEHELLCSFQTRRCQNCMWHLMSGSLATRTHFGHTPVGSWSSQWGAKSVFPCLFHQGRSFSRLEEKFPLRVSNPCNTNHGVSALRRLQLVSYSALCPLRPSPRHFFCHIVPFVPTPPPALGGNCFHAYQIGFNPEFQNEIKKWLLFFFFFNAHGNGNICRPCPVSPQPPLVETCHYTLSSCNWVIAGICIRLHIFSCEKLRWEWR